MADPGDSRGGVRPPSPSPLFLDQAEVRRAEEMFFWRAGPHLSKGLDGHQHGGRKPTQTSVTAVLQSVNLFLEELINIKVILYLVHELFR